MFRSSELAPTPSNPKPFAAPRGRVGINSVSAGCEGTVRFRLKYGSGVGFYGQASPSMTTMGVIN